MEVTEVVEKETIIYVAISHVAVLCIVLLLIACILNKCIVFQQVSPVTLSWPWGQYVFKSTTPLGQCIRKYNVTA